MKKRFQFFNILKKSQVEGTSEPKEKSETEEIEETTDTSGCVTVITLLGLLIITVPIYYACQPQEPQLDINFYTSVSDCVADQISQSQCQQAWDEAVSNHRNNQLSYATEAECKQETQNNCEAITQASNVTVYKPVMEGFLVEVETPNNTSTATTSTTRIFISQPVYGGYGSGYDRYRLADGEPLGVSRSRERTKISTSRASNLKSPSVGRSVTKGFGSSFKSNGRGASS